MKNFWPQILGKIDRYLLLALSLTAISGASVYFAYSLNWAGTILSVLVAAAAFVFLGRATVGAEESLDYRFDKGAYPLIITYGASLLALILMLFAARTDRALISPWQVVNLNFFWIYGLASLLLVLMILRTSLGSGWKILLLSFHAFWSFAVCLIVYKIGYGFDPFIHQATIELIVQKGLVLPKPVYYLGQYGLIAIASKLTGLTVNLLNLFLVPLLSAFFLPPALYRFLASGKEDERENPGSAEKSYFLTILFLLALTFSPFTLTTPQNLSYLFLILTILSGLEATGLKLASVLALATTAIHPLTGLPALAWILWLHLKNYGAVLNRRWQKAALAAIWIFSAFALPVSLVIAGGRWSSRSLVDFFAPFKEFVLGLGSAGREDWLLNFVYFVSANYDFFLILAIIAGLLIYFRRHSRPERFQFTGLLFVNSGLFIAYLASRQIAFTGLIDYEQAAYAERIPIVMTIFFLPFLILLLRRSIAKIRRIAAPQKISWLIFGLGLLCASLYLSYPRFDKYWNSRGYSTSASDLEAVQSISRQAAAPYVVLANQQVSAAALKVFGFDHYFKTKDGLLYFYPIPTGGPLYQYYLDMVYKNPVKENLNGVSALTGVKKAYLIINKYWYDSGRIINEGKLAADRWWSINGEDFIFEYDL